METRHLSIRRFQLEDHDDLAALIRDKMRSPSAAYDVQYPVDREGLLDLLDAFMKSDEFYAVERRDENGVIGFVALNRVDAETRNLGCCIRSDQQGKGYAMEAARCMIRYAAKELGARRIVSGAAEENAESVRLLTKLGFTLTGSQTASFARDAKGEPIVFTGCSFELKLN